MENEKMAKWGVVVLRTAKRPYYTISGYRYDSVELIPVDDYNLTLEQLYEWTDCRCIEIVRGKNGLMCLDDNGKCEHKPINALATDFYGNPHDFIVGDVVLGRADVPDIFVEPDFYAMPYRQAERLYGILQTALDKAL